MLYIRY